MAALDSLLPKLREISLATCGRCAKSITFALRGDRIPIHDPVTGEVICGECQPSHLFKERVNWEEQKRPLFSRGLTAYPLCLLTERKDDASNQDSSTERKNSNEGVSRQEETDDKYDKCAHHECVNWTYVDMDTFQCICEECSRCVHVSHHDLQGRRQAASLIRERLVSVITTPFVINKRETRSIACMDDNEQEHLIAGVGYSTPINLIQVVKRMTDTIKVFNIWLEEVMDTNNIIYYGLSTLRSSVYRNDLRTRMGSAIEWRDVQFKDACNIYITHLQSMIRRYQAIVETLVEGMRLLGLDVESGHLLTDEDVVKVLKRRKRNAATVGEEVTVLETLVCLRETLEYGDLLLVGMLRESVEDILNETGGIRRILQDLRMMTINGYLDKDNPMGKKKKDSDILKQLQSVLDGMMKAVPLLLGDQSEHWEISIHEWWRKKGEAEVLARENPIKAQDNALDIVIDALFDPYYHPKTLCMHPTNLFERYKSAMGEGNAFFIETYLNYQYSQKERYRLYRKAEMMGCHHPLLYHFLSGDVDDTTNACHRYKDVSHLSDEKLLGYAEMCIAGTVGII